MDCWDELVDNRYGVVTTRQLRSTGLSDQAIQRRVRSGALKRRCRSVFVLAGSPGGWIQDLWVALSAAGPDAVVSHRSAAVLHGLDGVDDDVMGGRVVELSVPRARRPQLASTLPASIHRTRHLPAADMVAVAGVPVTSGPRTLADLGTVVDADVVERALESALRLDLATLAQAEEVAAGLARPGCRGPAVLRRVLDRRPAGAAPTESDAETRFVQIVRGMGIAQPERQVAVTPGRALRLDFAWPGSRLAVEIDGAGTHASAEALGRDLRRQNRIVLGWLVLRFTWDDVVRYPEYVVETLRETWQWLSVGPPPRSVRKEGLPAGAAAAAPVAPPSIRK